MALRCLAILGSKNEPLYICASGDGDDQQTSSNTEADVFGFFGNGDDDDDDVSKKEASGFIGKPPSIRHEVRYWWRFGRDHSNTTIAWDRGWHCVSATHDWIVIVHEVGTFWIGSHFQCFDFAFDLFAFVDDDPLGDWPNRRVSGVIPRKNELEKVPTWEPLDGTNLSHGGIRCTYSDNFG